MSHELRVKSNMASRLIISVGGMELQNSLSKVLNINVSINLSCGDIFVSEQLLNNTQISPVLEQVGSKRVTERVR